VFKISDFRVQILDIGERRQDFRFRIQDLRFPGNCRMKSWAEEGSSAAIL